MVTSPKIMRAYEEVIEFIAAGTNPGSVIGFQPSVAVKERVAGLIYRILANSATRKPMVFHWMKRRN